jgi:two-component system, OmpR family, sensor histidine kinase CiaH
MANTDKRKLAVATLVYWTLLFYIIAALVWWFISLEKQNREMHALKLDDLKIHAQTTGEKIDKATILLEQEKERNTTKYIAEGLTFLALILLGAGFVYRAVRRQLKTQQQQQNFMMAVTHELKTPIAVAKLNLETLQKHQLDETKRQKLILMTIQETNRLSSYSLSKEELNMSDLVKGTITDFKTRFPQREWKLDKEDDIELTGDTLLLTILLNNLLENAMKYSPAGKPISCSLLKSNQSIELKVSDEGSGIPDIEKKRIFDKFYRIGNEATRTAKGTGLGLYLCKKIASDHNADIFVTDNTPSGSNFIVSFKIR